MEKGMSEMLYSPRTPMDYTRVNEDGLPFGIGRELAGEGRRAWWNLYWLSDPAVDEFLQSEEVWLAGDVLISFDLVKACALSVKQELGGRPMAELLVTLTPTQFLAHLEAHSYEHLEVFKVGGAGWLRTARDRAGLYRGSVSEDGKVVYASFGRKVADEKVEQSFSGSATIMPLSLREP
jgi:hypothetical protein